MKKTMILIILLMTLSCSPENKTEKSIEDICNDYKHLQNDAINSIVEMKEDEARKVFKYTNNKKLFKELIKQELEITKNKLLSSENPINNYLELCNHYKQINQLEQHLKDRAKTSKNNP